MASGPNTSWQIDGETMETVTEFIFLGSKVNADGDWSHEIKRCLLLERKAMKNLDSRLKSRDIIFLLSQSYGFYSSHVWMWELDRKEGWAPKDWLFWTVVLENIFESPLDSKKIKPVNPKGNQPWIFHWKDWCWSWNSSTSPPDVKNWLIWKDSDAGKDCHFLLQEIFLTQGLNPHILHLLHCRQIIYHWATGNLPIKSFNICFIDLGFPILGAYILISYTPFIFLYWSLYH